MGPVSAPVDASLARFEQTVRDLAASLEKYLRADLALLEHTVDEIQDSVRLIQGRLGAMRMVADDLGTFAAFGIVTDEEEATR